MTDYAPIAIFVYNRPEHTKRLVESLLKNEESKYSEVFFFSDGYKATKEAEKDLLNQKKIKEVREYLGQICGFKKVTIIPRDYNVGLAKNIIGGVSEILCTFEKIIVLEDDLEVSECFLGYMNNALDYYRSCENVYSISGYSFVSNDKNKLLKDTFFLPITCSWSWATWREKWDCFDETANGWEELFEDSEKRKQFNFGNSVDFTSMLQDQMNGKINSWAIRWYWSVFNKKGLTLYPHVSYVKNGGFDGSGTHTFGEPPGGKNALLNTDKAPAFPTDCKIDEVACKIVQNSLREKWTSRAMHKAKKVVITMMGRK
jgi:hypothetical protein